MIAARSSLLVGVVIGLGACAGAPASHPQLTPETPAPSASTPVAADPPPIVDGDVTFGSVNGIQVIVERSPGAAFAAGQLYVRGGPRNWTAQDAGIEDIAFRVAASGGTASLDRTAFSHRLADLGASISGDAHNDFSGLYLKTPTSSWDDALAQLAAAFLSPALPPDEIETVRAQMLAELRHEQDSPEGQLWALERKQLFAGHPYANRSVGSVESLTAIAAADVGPYLTKLRETRRLLFVAVGDLDAAHVLDQVRTLFASLPRGTYAEAPLPPIAFGAPRLLALERRLPVTYVEADFPAPGWSDPDWVTALLAANDLSWRVGEAVTNPSHLASSASAYVNQGYASPFGTLEIAAVDAGAAVRAVVGEARRLRDQPMSDPELASAKAVFLTGFLQGHETPDGQAASLADAQLYAGDWHLARTVPERVRAVTAADIQAFARKYLGHMQVAVVGDVGKVDPGLFSSL